MAEHPEAFDAVLIGAGQANNPLSRSLARAGKRVALIEKGKIGGTCVNTGCTPTKTMAASARVAYLARRASEYGVHTGAVRGAARRGPRPDPCHRRGVQLRERAEARSHGRVGADPRGRLVHRPTHRPRRTQWRRHPEALRQGGRHRHRLPPGTPGHPRPGQRALARLHAGSWGSAPPRITCSSSAADISGSSSPRCSAGSAAA